VIVVLDSSAALYELVSNVGIDDLARRHDLVAPALLWSEVTSVLNELRWRGEISEELADLAFARLLSAHIARRSGAAVFRAAGYVAAELGWAKTYDAEFVGLARSLDAPLYSRDARLVRGVRDIVRTVGPDEL